jgi:hypothetical protein
MMGGVGRDGLSEDWSIAPYGCYVALVAGCILDRRVLAFEMWDTHFFRDG